MSNFSRSTLKKTDQWFKDCAWNRDAKRQEEQRKQGRSEGIDTIEHNEQSKPHDKNRRHRQRQPIPPVGGVQQLAGSRQSQSDQSNNHARQNRRLNAGENPLAISENEKPADEGNQQDLRRIGVLRVRCVIEEIANLMPLKCNERQRGQHKQRGSPSSSHLRGASYTRRPSSRHA